MKLLVIILAVLLWLAPVLIRDSAVPFPGSATYEQAAGFSGVVPALSSILVLRIISLVAGIATLLSIWSILGWQPRIVRIIACIFAAVALMPLIAAPQTATVLIAAAAVLIAAVSYAGVAHACIVSLLLLIVSLATHEWVFPFIGVLADFGGSIPAVVWLSAVIGLVLNWTSLPRLVVMVIALVLFFTSINAASVLALPAWCAVASLGVYALWKRQWHTRVLRDLSMFAIAAGMIFFVIVTLSQIAGSQPSVAVAEIAQELGINDRVLALPSHAGWFDWWSSASVIARPATDSIWQMRNAVNVSRVMNESGINALIVTPAMKNSLVWHREKEGLLFVLNTSGLFSLDAQNAGVQLWRMR